MSEQQATQILNMLSDFKRDNKEQHKEIIKHQKETNGNVKKNTEFRFKFMGGLTTLKWLAGFIGAGNIAILIKLFI